MAAVLEHHTATGFVNPAAAQLTPGAQPVQIAPEWWMAVAETGYPYYHNTTTKETTWIQPVLSAPQPPALPADVRSLDQVVSASRRLLQSFLNLGKWVGREVDVRQREVE